MTEEQIRDGYDRLGGALAPPLDTLERVDRRVRARRRGRRAAVVGGTALGVLVVGSTVVSALGGDDGTGQSVAIDPPADTLVMTRADGSTYTFRDVQVTCDPPLGDEAAADGPQRIWALSPRRIVDERAVEPFVYFEGVVPRIAGDQTFTFPHDRTAASDKYPMVLFVADTDGNEAASSAGGGSGTVRVMEAACDPVPVLRLQVDMTLGSEEQQQPLDLAGRLP